MISRDDNATRVQAAEILTEGLLDVTNEEFTNAVRSEFDKALKMFHKVEKRNDDDRRNIAQVHYQARFHFTAIVY